MSLYGFPAAYPGTCSECDERFEAGELIMGQYGDYQHVACPDPLPPASDVCGTCFTERSKTGRCMCDE